MDVQRVKSRIQSMKRNSTVCGVQRWAHSDLSIYLSNRIFTNKQCMLFEHRRCIALCLTKDTICLFETPRGGTAIKDELMMRMALELKMDAAVDLKEALVESEALVVERAALVAEMVGEQFRDFIVP